jgi:WD40 repeat protein
MGDSTNLGDSIHIYDAANGQKILTIKTEVTFAQQLEFDGSHLPYWGLHDRLLKVWDTSTGQPAFELKGHSDLVESAVISPRGDQIATCSDDATVKLWDITTTRATHLSQDLCSPEGTVAAGALYTGPLYVWDPTSGREIHTLDLNSQRGSIRDFAFKPGDPRFAVVTLSRDAVFDLWDLIHGTKMRSFDGHKSIVNSVAYSPDGNSIISGSDDKTVKLWDASTGRALLSLTGLAEAVRQVGFSPDGNRIAGESAKGLKIWRASDGRELHTIPVDGEGEFVFSPNGKRILIRKAPQPSLGRIESLSVWDTDTGQQTITRTCRPKGTFEAAEFSPNSKWLAVAQNVLHSRVLLLDTATGQNIVNLPIPYHVTCVAFNPQCTRIATGGERIIDIWDISGGQKLVSFKGHTAEVRSLAFSPDSSRIASVDSRNTLKLWETSGGQQMLSLDHMPARPCIAFSRDGERIVSRTMNPLGWSSVEATRWRYTLGQMRYFGTPGWSAWAATRWQDPLSIAESASSVHFSPDGTKILSSGMEAETNPSVWDAKTGAALAHLPAPDGISVIGTAFSPNGKRIVSCDAQGAVRVWDAGTAQLVRSFNAANAPVLCVSFGSDERTVVTGSQDNAVRIWDLASGKLAQTFRGHTGAVNTLATSHNGRIASGSVDRTIRIWEIANAKEATTLHGHTGEVASVAFSPDGKWVASGSADQTIKVWEAASGREFRTLKGHTAIVQGVAFSPDGKLIASASDDASVRVWNAESGSEIRYLKGHKSSALDVAFSPDGRRLVSGGADRINVWRLEDVGWNSP